MEEIVGAAVERRGGDDFIAGRREGGDGEGFSGLARSRCKACSAAFESRDTLFEDVRRRVHDARVDVAELLECEKTAGMVGILKQVGRGLVDGDGAGASGGVG